MSNNKSLVYVDNVSGDNANPGDILAPVRTLQHAYGIAFNGATIILQGSDTSYGDLDVYKNLTITSSHGSRAKSGTISVYNRQVSILNLDFIGSFAKAIFIDNDVEFGEVVPGLAYGGINIKGNLFRGVSNPVHIKSADYISIHQNIFEDYTQGVVADDCIELVASSNDFVGPQSFVISNADYVDIFHNTFIGSAGVVPPEGENQNLRIIFVKISSTILARKYYDLPSLAYQTNFGYNVSINVVNGASSNYGTDYTVINSGLTVSWAGLDLEDDLRVNDILRIMYSEGSVFSPETSIVVSSNYHVSRVESNNINDAAVGVYFSKDLKIRSNNFYNTYTGMLGLPGVSSSDAVGNFSSDPKYVNKAANDFNLLPDSPDIGAADMARWPTVYNDLLIGFTGPDFLGIKIRPGVAPFNRDIDHCGIHRLIQGTPDDVGSHEFGTTGINPEINTYVKEDGYDLDVYGSITGAYGTLDRAFDDPKDIIVKTNILTPGGYTGVIDQGATGSQYGRYFSNGMNLSTDRMIIGKGNKDSIAYIYTSYEASFGLTGVFVGPTPPEAEKVGETGAIGNPFRDINDAITKIGSETGIIFVYPGFYPNFTGNSRIKVVGLPKITEIPLGKTLYNDIDPSQYGWTGAASAAFSNQSISFNGTENITSLFEMTGDLSIRLDFLVLVDSLEVGIYNATNFVSIKKSGTTLYLRYGTGGNTYTSSTTSTEDSFRVSIILKNNVATVRIKGYPGALTNLTYNVTFVSGYAAPWKMNFTYTDNALPGSTGVVNNFIAEAGSITMAGHPGQLGVTSVSTERRVYAILGEEGITGLYSWYGARI